LKFEFHFFGALLVFSLLSLASPRGSSVSLHPSASHERRRFSRVTAAARRKQHPPEESDDEESEATDRNRKGVVVESITESFFSAPVLFSSCQFSFDRDGRHPQQAPWRWRRGRSMHSEREHSVKKVFDFGFLFRSAAVVVVSLLRPLPSLLTLAFSLATKITKTTITIKAATTASAPWTPKTQQQPEE